MTETATTVFVSGATYSCRSIGDHNCVWAYEVTRRTTKTVWLKECGTSEVKAFRVKVWNGVECVLPKGSYSMAPTLAADSARREAALIKEGGCYRISNEDKTTSSLVKVSNLNCGIMNFDQLDGETLGVVLGSTHSTTVEAFVDRMNHGKNLPHQDR